MRTTIVGLPPVSGAREPVNSDRQAASLPARFYHSGQFAMGSKITKANPADTEFSDIRSGTATNRTSIVGPHFEFRFSYRFVSKRLFSQIVLLTNDRFQGSEFTVQGYVLKDLHRFCCNMFFCKAYEASALNPGTFEPQFLKGMPNNRRSSLPSSSVLALVTILILSPIILSILSYSISGNIICSLIPRE